MTEFKFDDPKLEAYFEREMEDGLEAYELRRILKRAQILQIQNDNQCSEQAAAQKWQALREKTIQHVQDSEKCSRDDAERYVRRAEVTMARERIDKLGVGDRARKRPSKSGCLGILLGAVAALAAAISRVIS